MNKKFFIPAFMMAAVLASCNNMDDSPQQAAGRALDVNVSLNDVSSRAMVNGTSLAEGEIIGVSVTAADGSAYDGNTTGYLNVAYTSGAGTGTSQPWTGTSDILLSGTEGKAYAYYPYTANTDFTAIAVDIVDQKDWMYSGEGITVSDADCNVQFQLSHAQTALSVTVARGNKYTGTGAVTALTVTSDGLAKTGTLNAGTGTWLGIAGAGSAISISDAFNLAVEDASTTDVKESEKSLSYMFIPAGVKADFTVNMTLDGKPYSAVVGMTEAFAAGKVYKVSLNFDNEKLNVNSVVILNDWSTVDLEDGTLTPAN